MPKKKIKKHSIHYFRIIFFTLLVLVIIGYLIHLIVSPTSVNCKSNERYQDGKCIPIICSDGTKDFDCSTVQPMQCNNGNLVPNAIKCGCPENYSIYDNNCKKICSGDYIEDGLDCKKVDKCSDGTIYVQCSKTKPLYCNNGNLTNLPTVCGCPENQILFNGSCINYNYGPKYIWLPYHYNKTNSLLKIEVYQGMDIYLESKRHGVTTYNYDYMIQFIDEPKESKYLDAIVGDIRNITNNTDEQAKIAISLVQIISYGTDNNYSEVYPYQVLYREKGVCGEKSYLLAYLLRGLNFSVALLNFNYPDNHMAVGIKCPEASFRNSSYCLVETTSPGAAVNSYGLYTINGQTTPLTTDPVVVPISDGISLNNTKYDNEWYVQRLSYDLTSCPAGSFLCNGECYVHCSSGVWSCTPNGGMCTE